MMSTSNWFLLTMLVLVSLLSKFGVDMVTIDTPQQRVLMISFDGFRHDYLEMATKANRNISTFRRLWEGGVRAGYIKNVFITRTFPNHHTLVTGLYEESHGIVDNNFWDDERNSTFSKKNLKNMLEPGWFLGEPIWATVERHGQSSGVIQWPGSTAPVGGILPRYSTGLFSFAPALDTRMDQVVRWLVDDPHLSLALLYFHEPDSTGHHVGPDSPAILDRVEELNAALGYLLDQLSHHPRLAAELNILLVSDHGMTNIAASRVIKLEDHVSTSWFRTHGEECYPIVGLWPVRPELTEKIFKKLNATSHLTVYHKADIPERYHYKDNRRIAPLLLVADEGWSIVHKKKAGIVNKGDHGYSNDLSSMHPYFIAHGPAFVKGLHIPLVHMVDIYPLICHILGIKDPAPNNGSLHRIRHVLKQRTMAGNHVHLSTTVTMISTILLAVLLTLTLCIAAVVQRRRHHKEAMARVLMQFRSPVNVPTTTRNGMGYRQLAQDENMFVGNDHDPELDI